MARVTAPLMGLDASKQLGKAIVYSKWKGKNYVRRYLVPENPQTSGQMYVRGCMANAVTEWQALSAGDKETWDDNAKGTGMSGFNLFTSTYMKLYV